MKVKIRDRYSLELKIAYLLQDVQPSRKAAHQGYQLDCYLFLPHSFGILPATYSRERLYDDLKVYIRFNTPIFDLDELMGDSPASPLFRLERMFANLGSRRGAGTTGRDTIIYEIKMLACVYKSLLRNRVIAGSGQPTATLFADLHLVARRYHALVSRLRAMEIDDSLMQHFSMADEHISLLLERYIIIFLQSRNREEQQEEHRLVLEILEEERRYRTTCGYPTVARRESSGIDLEQYTYREKELKRYASQILFFNVRQRFTAKRAEHAIYAVAAGLAMTFATTIAFLGQTMFGNFTVALFILLVTSYILKDRLKDLFRDLFREIAATRYYDRLRKLYDPHTGHKLATVRERTMYANEQRLTQSIRELRNRGGFERALYTQGDESILVYNRRIDINIGRLRTTHRRIRGLADITILGLRRLLRFLSSTEVNVPIVGDSNELEFSKVPRTYHLNMIIHYRGTDATFMRRFRLVVNAKGIRRLEPV